MSLKEVAARLQTAQSFFELLPLLREQEVAYLLAHATVGQDWRNWLVDRLDQFFQQDLGQALGEVEDLKKALAEVEERAKATPFEEEAPSPESAEPTEPTAPVAPVAPTEAEKAEPSEATVEKAEAAPTASAEAEEAEPSASTEEAEVTAKKPASSIATLAQRAIRAREDFYARAGRAYEELLEALADERLIIDPEAEYVDLQRDFAQKAITWLQIRIAKGEMTAAEAVARARSEGWVKEISVSPKVYRAMMEGFRRANLYLIHHAVVNGERLNLPTELAQAIEAGELSVEEAVELARQAGWTRPYQASGPGTLEEILGPEKVQELRELRGRKSPTSTSKKGKKRQ